jgi:hypothetical protein
MTTKKPAWAVALDIKRPAEDRIAAFVSASSGIYTNETKREQSLAVLRDAAEPLTVRQAVLSAFQAGSFSINDFNPARAQYFETLRAITADENYDLRQRVLGILSRAQDGYTQKLLLDGLHHPKKSLLPPEKALQLLSYDVHAEAYPVARAILNAPPNPAAKREALRLLAADASSAPEFKRLLNDKNEPLDIRQLCASALHTLAPSTFQTMARSIVLDDNEDDDLRATCLSALTHFGDEDAVAGDHSLYAQVDMIHASTSNEELQLGTKSFLRKYRR